MKIFVENPNRSHPTTSAALATSPPATKTSLSAGKGVPSETTLGLETLGERGAVDFVRYRRGRFPLKKVCRNLMRKKSTCWKKVFIKMMHSVLLNTTTCSLVLTCYVLCEGKRDRKLRTTSSRVNGGERRLTACSNPVQTRFTNCSALFTFSFNSRS